MPRAGLVVVPACAAVGTCSTGTGWPTLAKSTGPYLGTVSRMPPPKPLTAERIVQATEEVLRRHGFAKATVVDVSCALGVSHASVYRHFASKAALHEAVTKR